MHWILLILSLAPSCLLAQTPYVAGESAFLENGLRGRKDILFFSGFESRPWNQLWGMKWGPTPAENGSLVEGNAAFDLEGHSLRVCYPAGKFASAGGFQFHSEFKRLGIQPRDSVFLRYYLRFDPGFDFVKGGKLPGLAGGEANSGGHKPTGRDGWSARLMWRRDGRIVQYLYYPDQPDDYGQDFEWKQNGQPCYFKPGAWHCVETHVVMNHPGQHDGLLESWLDGAPALKATRLRFRDLGSLQVDGLAFSTFFGGGDASWAPGQDQCATFDNFVLATHRIGARKK